MVRLQNQLKYFISKKISTDRIWKNVRVILSGHEVCASCYRLEAGLVLLFPEPLVVYPAFIFSGANFRCDLSEVSSIIL